MKAKTKTARKSVAALVGASALALGMSVSPAALAGTEEYLGELLLVGFNFCPRNTAAAEGQLLSISTNTALFSLLGTTYGGDGRTTFGLPDLRGRSAIGTGQGPGLSPVTEGERAGVETVTLTANQMPSHTHAATASATLRANDGAGNSAVPTGNSLASKARTDIYSNAAPNVAMHASAIVATVNVAATGGSQPVSVRNPYLAMRYCVVTQGIFPSRP